MAADRLSAVLDSTHECLLLYGVRRTTMDDIAQRTGLSRSSLYTYVRNKDEAFRLLAERLHRRALDAAQAAAARKGATAEQRALGILTAKLDLVLALKASPHVAELLDARTRLCGDICSAFSDRLRAFLVDVFEQAGTDRPQDAADICLTVLRGFESSPDQAHLMEPAAEAVINGLLQPRPTAGSVGPRPHPEHLSP
ncbi:TetR/AcrR family transcriptional regulator [Streptacidiphilus pinicola]|uniref:TetR/AcrR family transcriptional regulator n=1 Tax=Streptacidiphilus pinicola TaxID=2219663 RepID=A0A2X0IG55_9ACTN|nr:TetR/AcrR family transcriptional regulator [Streptacidiphilus pinicola]RAG84014.1 TetR/AcrR family transcriptional regulator [Streptacidiphilus pinicola]